MMGPPPNLPMGSLPPFDFKVPQNKWRVFFEAMRYYSGRAYVDRITLGYSGELQRQLDATNRVFKRRQKNKPKRARSNKDVTLSLPRESLSWIRRSIIERAASDAVSIRDPWWDRYDRRECVDFHYFAAETAELFEREVGKTAVELLGEIQT